MEKNETPPAPSSPLRRWMAWIMAGVLVASIAAWYAARERLPSEIRIATGAKGGLYYRFGEVLGAYLEKSTGRKVRLVETKGSLENHDLLARHEADLAVMQSGSTSMEDVAVLAPLYREPVVVIVRAGAANRPAGVDALRGRKIVLGAQGSGMRESARAVLEHYRVAAEDLRETERYFMDLKADAQLEGAVVTTGLENPDLRELLAGGGYEILPIEDAEAISLHNPFLIPSKIPRGFFCANPPVPAVDTPTVASTAMLTCSTGAGNLLVERTMAAYFENPMVWKLPSVLSRKDAQDWPEMTMHPAARAYHDPYAGIGLLANFMESIAAIKELLFALGAGLYLAWDRYRKMQERAKQAEFTRQKEHLDDLLNETVKIEKAQMDTEDPKKLKEFLDEVTRIKLRALDELTHEDLRGDQFFAIFLAQCANLIRKIQSKLFLLASQDAKRGHPTD
ncbi:MAG: TAXI family TRAP transporter solute-binding subunit [Planctomycetota bacterium]|nr:TAXI family TRAP transporter solute-binding subunit [Planctomycetota bacterium]